MRQHNNQTQPFGGLFGIIILVGFVMFTFYSLRFFYNILLGLAPLLFIAAAIIRFSVIRSYVQMLGRKFSENWMMGLVYIAASIIFYPLVGGFLFYKAMSSRRNKKRKAPAGANKNRGLKGEYIEYEEVEINEENVDFERMRRERKSFESLFEESNEKNQ